MSNNQNNPQGVPQVNARMENEPQEIYLVCYDLSETNKDYLPEDNDFESLKVKTFYGRQMISLEWQL